MSKHSQFRKGLKRQAILDARHSKHYIGHAVEVLSIGDDFLLQDGNHFYGMIDGKAYDNIEDKEDFLFLCSMSKKGASIV